MKYNIIKDYSNARFKASIGISREIFEKMAEVLRIAYIKCHSKHNGRHRKLSIEDILLAALEYLYEYRTFECSVRNAAHFVASLRFAPAFSCGTRCKLWYDEARHSESY